MTTTNNAAVDYDVSPPTSSARHAASTSGQIDRMIQNPNPSVNLRGQTQQDLRIDSDGNLTALGPPVAAAPHAPPAFDPMNEVAAADATIANLGAKLAQLTYDKTGKASPAITGRDRELIEIQLASARNAHTYAVARAVELFPHREAEVAAERQALSERAMTHAFTQGDPSRAAALSAALAQAEAREAAEAIVASRRRG